MSAPDQDAEWSGAPSTHTVETQPSDYITRAIDLRNAIYFNGVDHTFAHENLGEIRYVFDTNVVMFFLNPFREYHRVSPFAAVNDEAAQALALVTAEYLFSRKLLGQGGLAPLISTAHAREFDNKIAGLMSEPTKGQPGIVKLTAKVEYDLRQTVTSLMGSAHDHALLRSAIDSGTASLGGAGKNLVQKAFVAQQFNRLMATNLLRPLHTDNLMLQLREHSRTPRAQAEDAKALEELTAWKSLHRSATALQSEADDNKDEADMRTALEVVRLNAAAMGDRRSKPIRYVLVTTDRTLHNAVIDWLRHEGKGQLEFYPVRRILQYAPFLNINDMPNGIADSELYQDVGHAVDAFLTSCDISLGDLPRILPMWSRPKGSATGSPFEEPLQKFADQMSQRLKTDPGARATLNRLAAEWRRLGRESVFLNANLLSRRLKPFAALAAFLSKSKDVTRVVEGFMAETVASVERGHVKFGVHHYLQTEIEAAMRRADRGNVRRGMIVLTEPFAEVQQSEPLVVLLDNLIYGDAGHRIERMNQILAVIDQSNVALHKVIYISACVAFWASRWGSADQFAQRARQLAGSKAPVAYTIELDYLRLVAQRYRTMDSALTPQKWVSALTDRIPRLKRLRSTAQDTGDSFSVCRFDLEHGLILITAGFASCLDDGPEANEAARNFIQQGADRIEEAALYLTAPGVADLNSTARRFLTAEMIVGLAGAGLYLAFLDPEPQQTRRDNWRRLAALTPRLIEDAYDIVPEVYHLAPELFELAEERDPARFEERRGSLMAKMALQAEAGLSLTVLDRRILEHMGRRMADPTWSPQIDADSAAPTS